MAISEKETQRSDNARRGGDLFIVDNSDTDWKVLDYLGDWSEISQRFDIATGALEIGALLALDAGLLGVKNGALLRAAAAQFDVLITVDQKMRFQQNLQKQ